MSFNAFWPATFVLSMFIVLVIMLILKYGPRWFNARHTTFTDDEDWEGKTYEQKVSYA